MFDSARNDARRIWEGLGATRQVLVAAGLALTGLVFFGSVKPLPALLAGLCIIVAAAIAARSQVVTGGNSEPPSGVQSAPHELLGQTIAAIPDPVIILETDGTVIAANARALAIAPALRSGQPVLLALRMPAVIEAIRRAAGGEPQRAEFSERVPIDRWYEAHVLPTPADMFDGRRLLLLTFHDLTPLRHMEEMRADFIANASHELRTPLATLSGFIDTLQGPAREDPAARDRFLDIMKAQAQRMGRLIDDLLSLSRIERSAHIHPHAAVEVVGIVRQVVDSLQMLAQERQVDVKLTAPERVQVIGERDELVRVFENLVENALKYGSAGKRVDIVIDTRDAGDGREARIAVRDYGPGIATEHLPRLTERFYRIDVGQSRAEGGTGLGLALVKHILNRHRGRLVIESTVGAGSTFSAHLPAVSQSTGDSKNTQEESIL